MERRIQSEVEVVAVAANARFSHTSMSLRALKAVLDRAGRHTVMVEGVLEDRPADMVERILGHRPRAVLLSVHLWNSELMTNIAMLLRRVAPDLRLAAGGPEMQGDPAVHPLFPWVDYVVRGEGEAAVVPLVDAMLSEKNDMAKIIDGPPPDLSSVPLPYDLYSDADIRNRVVYVETSRGCPSGCEFCLSALDKTVRRFSETAIAEALEMLWQRGARRFKFIDRALHLGAADMLLDFFEPRAEEGIFLHFELIPDRLPPRLLERLRAFPPGSVQVEAGVQTLSEAVSARICRKQNLDKALRTLSELRQTTGVHIHADLVVGLPGETQDSFAEGFDRLYALGLHEIQVGILKKLPGAPIARHDAEWRMTYNPRPPYDILANRDIDFSRMQSLKRFAKFHDLVCNRGNFRVLVPHLIGDDSPFRRLFHLSNRLYEQTGRTHGIALNRLAALLSQYAVEERGVSPETATQWIEESFEAAGRSGRGRRTPTDSVPSRQRRHLG